MVSSVYATTILLFSLSHELPYYAPRFVFVLSGGLVATIPSTTVVSAMGLALTAETTRDVSRAMYAAPMGGLIIEGGVGVVA